MIKIICIKDFNTDMSKIGNISLHKGSISYIVRYDENQKEEELVYDEYGNKRLYKQHSWYDGKKRRLGYMDGDWFNEYFMEWRDYQIKNILDA